MGLYNEASLIMYPSGVKASKIYSQKPTNGSGDLTFTRASTATRVNESGLIESVASGVPRIDFTGGGCGKLLLEPQRTNVLLQSENFSSGSWTKIGCTVSANATTAPDGTTTADKIISSLGSDSKRVAQTISFTSGTTYTVSCFFKQAEWGYAFFNSPESAFTTRNDFVVNLANGSIELNNGGSGSVIDYGDGWYRLIYTRTATATISESFRVGLSNNPVVISTGDGTSGVYYWGAQLEVGSYPTSYIPTAGSTVTRLADAAYKTGISSLIGQTEGTIYWEGVVNGSDNPFANLVTSERNTNTAFSTVYKKIGSQFQCAVFDGATKGQCTGGSVVIGQKHKLAYAYKSGDFVLYVDGVQVDTSTDTWTPPATIDDLYLGDPTTFFGYKEGVTYNNTMLFKTRLSNVELATLTTL